MKINKTFIEDLLIIEPQLFKDDRGFFYESYNKNNLDKVINVVFVQDNESKSSFGVLRGLHYQLPPNAQTKLVRVTQGAILDVVVDIREGSPTFGQHVATELSAENNNQLLIPRGFAHGFVVLSKEAIFAYKVDNYYSPECDRGIAFDDPALKIDWKLDSDQVKLSAKDAKQPKLIEAEYFNYHINLYK